MTEQEMYAAIGRKQTELDNLNTEYDRLLAVLGEVASGAIHPQFASVDLTARTWAISLQPPVLDASVSTTPEEVQ